MSTSGVDACRGLYESTQHVIRQLHFGSPFRLLVTGSRTWADDVVVQAVQYGVAAAVGGPVHQTDGACHDGGLDAVAFILAEFRMAGRGWTTHRVPAAWFNGWRYSGRNPGHERNQKMVDIGHDLCIGFPDPVRSAGTWDCLTRAYMADIPAYAVMGRNGQWTLERFAPRRTHDPAQSTIDFMA